MQNSLTWLFETEHWPARWSCGEWPKALGWTHIISDAFVFSAYVTIPVVLAFFVMKRRDTVFPRIFWLFAVFIFACGMTHLVEAVIFWQPVYRFAGLMKLITAVASWATVAALVRVVPQALELPGLAAINTRLEAEVAERRAAQQKFEEANAELLLRNDELQQFLYTVSHDLKSPLVTARNFIGVLKEDVSNGDVNRIGDSISRIQVATDRMQELITDVLQLSRAGGARLEREWIHPQGLLTYISDVLAESAGRQHVVIQTPLPQVYADRVRLYEVFQNLLSNAVTYGCPEPESRVRVEATDDGQGATFRISDEGPGIAEEFHNRVFRPFERLRTDGEGTGVGLSIVKRIIDNHGGRIWIEASESGGAVFAFTLPHPQAGSEDVSDRSSGGNSSGPAGSADSGAPPTGREDGP